MPFANAVIPSPAEQVTKSLADQLVGTWVPVEADRPGIPSGICSIPSKLDASRRAALRAGISKLKDSFWRERRGAATKQMPGKISNCNLY
jgi:hypothetical protein